MTLTTTRSTNGGWPVEWQTIIDRGDIAAGNALPLPTERILRHSDDVRIGVGGQCVVGHAEVQALQRGRVARADAKHVVELRHRQHDAAVKIQALQRGKIGRAETAEIARLRLEQS